MKSALITLHVLFLLCAIYITETVSVIEGDSVTLHTDVTEIQRYDEIEWILNGYPIARINGGSINTEGSSRDRLQLDTQTGDLKITNIKSTDSGQYILNILKISTTTRRSSKKTFNVNGVSGVDEGKSVSVTVGDSVTLNSGTIIQRDDVIEWRFGDLNSPIAEHNRKTGNFSTSDGPDGRFRDRLQLDYLTGSLTIRKTGTKHSGFYEAGIRKSSSRHTIHKSYNVTVSDEMKSALSVMKGESVTLHSGLTEIQREDFMQWMFGDSVLAEINKAHKQFNTHVLDGRFRDRLELDEKTGSLIITNIRTEHAGLYELQIIIIRFTINKRITVTVDPGLSPVAIVGIVVGVLLVYAVVVVAAGVIYYRRKKLKESVGQTEIEQVTVNEGGSVTLETDVTDIQKYDEIQWRFSKSGQVTRIAEITGETKGISPSAHKIFQDRLKLDHQTGSLTITNTRPTDAGIYMLDKYSRGYVETYLFKVKVSEITKRRKV